MTVIDFIRHGEPNTRIHDNLLRPLTVRGQQQAHTIATNLASIPYTAIYASPAVCATETVLPLAKAIGKTVIQDNRLIERHMPAWIADSPGYVGQQRTDLTHAQTGGESIRQVQARSRTFIQSLPSDGIIAVGTHGTTMSGVVEMIWPGHGASFFATLQFTDVIRVQLQAGEPVRLTVPRPFSVLGQTVTVAIDRPLGTAHPEHPKLIYPVNYGEVPQLVGGDGEKQDVYVLGPKTPLSSWTGRIQAVIHRTNDLEDKWVGAAQPVSAVQIKTTTNFQEQYFASRLISLGNIGEQKR